MLIFKFISPEMELVFGLLQILGRRVKDLILYVKGVQASRGLELQVRPFVSLL